MTEPTTQELIEWLDNEAVVRMYRKDRDMAHAIAERLRAMQWRPVTDDEPAIGGTYLCRWQIDNPLPTTAAATRHDIHDWRENCDPRDNYCPPDFWMPIPQPPDGE